MALTKANTVIENDVTLTAAAADDVSATQTLTGNYSTLIRVRLTNGATGPTIAAQCKVQIAEADTAALFMTLATLVGGVTNSGVYEWCVQIPDSAEYLRLVGGSNTGQNVTYRAVQEQITAL